MKEKLKIEKKYFMSESEENIYNDAYKIIGMDKYFIYTLHFCITKIMLYRK